MEKQKNFSITLLQVVSAIAVVYMHCNGCFWKFSATESYWRSANVIECIFFFAVPVFFMVTGITLMDYQERYSTREFFKRRVIKAVIPFVCWSFIGIVHDLIIHRITLDQVTVEYILKGLITGNSIVEVYWFFVPLFCIYLAMPLFAAVPRDKRKDIFTYVLAAGFVINNLIPFLWNILNIQVDFTWPYYMNIVSGYYIWVLLGYVLYNYPPGKKLTCLLCLLGIVGLMMHIFGTMILSLKAGEIVSTYKGYNNVPCILYTIAVFLVVMKIGDYLDLKGKTKLVNMIGKYTFPIYLIHYTLLHDIIRIFNIDDTWIVFRLAAPFIIIPICILITWVLRKIPVVKMIVP